MLRIFLLLLLSATSVRADTLDNFVTSRLRDAVFVYDQALRNVETGQYLDSIRLDDRAGSRTSSIAATGMGLISLAIGDALGIIPDAETKAEVTLTHLLGVDQNTGFHVERSASGWYRHWFNINTGTAPKGNKDKFSTIDTAILGAGAEILASYFRDKAAKSNTPIPRAAQLAQELVMSINWTTAIRDPKRGSIHLVFFGTDERPTKKTATIPFDEYALLPCMAAGYEAANGREGVATKAWRKHFDMVDDLPMSDYDDLTLLGKPTGNVPSHFTHQFAFYLCGAYARDPAFLEELRELREADRRWFVKDGAQPGLWGLGAGSEVVFDENGEVLKYRYGVSRLGKNPNGTASPAIMAGFLPVDFADGKLETLNELKALWDNGSCRYQHQGLGFLWRCSPKDTSLRVRRLEAIDFSTWMLGLATAHPEIGLAFFQRHAL
ncbi:hypothetical protein F9L33_07115 [Amylibacter sp. SFDW26]|uniref:hypothetical protein n=1 Tax=Amylibacter sp. SFDW26 TaxID=2652722 RepID=UPI001261BEDA|nr:hypothetical protein [Amylibacter sp. SFDW26]KAB7614408.1 hypothetical protein F9L33_07115 [Amylibacter sp. SFDW26]